MFGVWSIGMVRPHRDAIEASNDFRNRNRDLVGELVQCWREKGLVTSADDPGATQEQPVPIEKPVKEHAAAHSSGDQILIVSASTGVRCWNLHHNNNEAGKLIRSSGMLLGADNGWDTVFASVPGLVQINATAVWPLPANHSGNCIPFIWSSWKADPAPRLCVTLFRSASTDLNPGPRWPFLDCYELPGDYSHLLAASAKGATAASSWAVVTSGENKLVRTQDLSGLAATNGLVVRRQVRQLSLWGNFAVLLNIFVPSGRPVRVYVHRHGSLRLSEASDRHPRTVRQLLLFLSQKLGLATAHEVWTRMKRAASEAAVGMFAELQDVTDGCHYLFTVEIELDLKLQPWITKVTEADVGQETGVVWADAWRMLGLLPRDPLEISGLLQKQSAAALGAVDLAILKKLVWEWQNRGEFQLVFSAPTEQLAPLWPPPSAENISSTSAWLSH
eukprot:TRINITY_DN18475_c0_g1_i1.p1 TRINITY_DN18475_c0_g1~~TRINITY_DN18475_c0_g1_i1.p1  ORF type:complete len:479 (+),score=52.57 TRINITY_DN18475_c0_g1_i1:102-1439(+)